MKTYKKAKTMKKRQRGEEVVGAERAVERKLEHEIFVGNLSSESTEEGLIAQVSRYGEVSRCHLPRDRESGQIRGFGFISFRSRPEAEAALEAGSIDFDGRKVSLLPRRPREILSSSRQKGPVWGKAEEDESDMAMLAARSPKPDAAKPNFGLSGALAKDEATGNMYKGHVLKFSEPADAVAPRDRWRIYVFKENTIIETLHIHRQSAFLVGRIKEICEILTMHASCSGQHAVIQFRARTFAETNTTLVLPYIMDLHSTNGTSMNGTKIDAARYYEIRHKDLINFGQSSRDYVFVNTALDDENKAPVVPRPESSFTSHVDR